jgi:hypothetical protein
VRKNHYGEWAHHGILAEVEKRDAASSMLYPKNFARNALIFPDVLARLSNRKTVRRSGQRGIQQS